MFELPEDTKEIQSAARDFAQEFVAEGAAERDLSHEFPAEIVNMMAENQFLGMFIPEEYGGMGVGGLESLDVSLATSSLKALATSFHGLPHVDHSHRLHALHY